MMRYILISISALLLTDCVGGPCPIPNEANIPWQYPQLFTTGCPDLTGVYEQQSGGAFYTRLMTKEAQENQSLYIDKVIFFEIKQQPNGFYLRYGNESQQKSVFIKIDGVAFGCADNHLIIREINKYQYGGEIPSVSSLMYKEFSLSKLKNGDLNSDLKYGEFYENSSGYKVIEPKISNFIIKRIK